MCRDAIFDANEQIYVLYDYFVTHFPPCFYVALRDFLAVVATVEVVVVVV